MTVILTNEEKAKRLEHRVSYFIDCPFDETISKMEAEDFIKDVLVKRFRVKYIVVGTDFRFGHEKRGDYHMLQSYAEKYGYEAIRYFLVSSQYRSPINYSVDIIEQAKNSLDRLYTCRDNIDFALKNAADGGEAPAFLEEHKQKFITAMEDDLNTADALAAVFSLVREINTAIQGGAGKAALEAFANVFDELTGVLGLVYNRKTDNLDSEIEELIEKRTQARKAKDFKTADQIRDQLKEMGIILEDTPQGVKWTRA